MFAEKFRSYGIKITGKYICESQNWIWSFLPILPSKTLTQIFIIIHRKKEIIHSSRKVFSEDVFFPAERVEEDYGVEKLPKFNLLGHWSQVLINSTIFAIFTLLISVLFCNNLALSMLKCEGSLT